MKQPINKEPIFINWNKFLSYEKVIFCTPFLLFTHNMQWVGLGRKLVFAVVWALICIYVVNTVFFSGLG